MASVLNEAYFTDEAAAFAALEAIVWPNGPTCPHCGATDRLNRLPVQRTKASKKHPQGKPVYGLWKCYHCRGQFTVRKNTVFEASHLELHKWFQAAFLMCSSKKGVSSNQLHRTLGCTLKTAWFVSHRIREAMREGELAVPFGAGGDTAAGKAAKVMDAADAVHLATATIYSAAEFHTRDDDQKGSKIPLVSLYDWSGSDKICDKYPLLIKSPQTNQGVLPLGEGNKKNGG
jgi:transposase-like protein